MEVVMTVKHKSVKTIMTKSKLPASDYAVNPYVGCPHKCVYCYACFMKRFTGHDEPWGEFIDIKESLLYCLICILFLLFIVHFFK